MTSLIIFGPVEPMRVFSIIVEMNYGVFFDSEKLASVLYIFKKFGVPSRLGAVPAFLICHRV